MGVYYFVQATPPSKVGNVHPSPNDLRRFTPVVPLVLYSNGCCLPESAAQLVVVHVRLALAHPPQPRQLVGVLDEELAVVALPRDHVAVLLLLQQLQDEVPELDLPAPGARLGFVGPVWIGNTTSSWGERNNFSNSPIYSFWWGITFRALLSKCAGVEIHSFRSHIRDHLIHFVWSENPHSKS